MKALKVRLYPTPKQADFLNQQFGAVRMVYNKGLAIMRHRYKHHRQFLSAYHDLKKLIPIAKKSRKYSWLNAYDSTSIQEALRNLDKAFKKFFRKQSGYPKFKNKHVKQSSYHCSGSIGYGDNWIKIGKLPTPIKARIHRQIDNDVSSITISREPSGKYYASLIFVPQIQQIVNPLKMIDSSKVIGLDVGLSHLLINSKGEKQENPRFLNKAYRNLRRKQKSLSRKKKGSVSRNKARLLVAKCHEKLAFVRNDFQHKISRSIVDENQAIIVETLKIKNMIKNRNLAKHIADASWGMLIEKIQYKAKQAGKYFIKLDQWYPSSKTCHCCHYKVESLSLKIRQWQCPQCTIKHDRDINAAINIKQQGLISLKAEGLSVSAN